MTPARLQQLRERFPVGGINTLASYEVHELLARISTLESEIQQVRVERDGLREALIKAEADMVAAEMLQAANGRWSEWGDRATWVADKLDVAIEGVRTALTPAPAARTETE